MQAFRKILLITRSSGGDTEAFKQAFSLSRANQATLEILTLCPEMPATMQAQQAQYQELLAQQSRLAAAEVRSHLKLTESDPQPTFKLQITRDAAADIIRHVLRNDFDLIIKTAEPKDGTKGFRAMDMELLRKCPCAVWLCQPITGPRQEIRVAVAVDPETQGQADHDLALRLLRLARALADSCSGDLQLISCWHYEFEDFLRHNPWARVKETEATNEVKEWQQRHRGMLDALISESGIAGTLQVAHKHARPEQGIPNLVKSLEVDILVMGTVARTGIPGFLMGNTAEEIVDKLDCSLVALKPAGFVSPINAY